MTWNVLIVWATVAAMLLVCTAFSLKLLQAMVDGLDYPDDPYGAKAYLFCVLWPIVLAAGIAYGLTFPLWIWIARKYR